ncbi:radical SAM additional 4Fe3S-binding SPASM domain [Candidatus Symbiothrix dinenymphae]|nr:radical SAM additional 4Fe3S-binding SPASM domain [Candidatus Symbiothrix dinenymphae]
MLNRLSQSIFNLFKANETRLHELSYLFWECTQRCNLKCRHCGSDCTANSAIRDMPFDDFLQAILPLKSAFFAKNITVAITGGEPLLRSDLAQCGKALRQNGFRWGIVTNGYAYTPEVHAQLLSAGMGAITLSLDGLHDTHNWLRANPHSFDNAVRALDLIASSKRLFYDVVTCVNHRNINELPLLKEFLISKNVKAWRLFTIAPIGRAKDNADLQLTPHELTQLMDFIANARTDKRIDTKFSCEAYVGKYERKVRDACFFCRAGINIASVLIDGSISACPNINRHFAQGNIKQDNFLDVWNSRFEVMRDRSWTKTGICAKCRDYRNCKGGAMHLWDEKQDAVMGCIHQKINDIAEKERWVKAE